MKKIVAALAAAPLAIAFVSHPALAQEAAQSDAPQSVAPEPVAEAAPVEAAAINEDEIADSLNAQQQLQQTVIFTRSINGAVIESEEKTVTYTRDDPIRDTEAGQSAIQKLRLAFDKEVLTRKEAFEEAKLDFTLADLDRDKRLTSDEFVRLVETWRDNEAREAAATTPDLQRQQRYVDFIAEIDPAAADTEVETKAREKFLFMAGAAATLSQKDYLREYLLDFDSLDTDDDGYLKGDELMRFRAVNRGHSAGM